VDNKPKYYLQKIKTLSPEVVIRKFFSKVKDKGSNTIGKISANVFGTETTDAGFLKKAWNSSYQFNNLEELQKYFCERKEPKFFTDLSKRKSVV